FAIRMGMRMVRGLSQTDAMRIVAARAQRTFTDVADLARRAELDLPRSESGVRAGKKSALACLADAGALRAIAGHRHRARWSVAGLEARRPLLDGIAIPEEPIHLPLPSIGEELLAD